MKPLTDYVTISVEAETDLLKLSLDEQLGLCVYLLFALFKGEIVHEFRVRPKTIEEINKLSKSDALGLVRGLLEQSVKPAITK